MEAENGCEDAWRRYGARIETGTAGQGTWGACSTGSPDGEGRFDPVTGVGTPGNRLIELVGSGWAIGLGSLRGSSSSSQAGGQTTRADKDAPR